MGLWGRYGDQYNYLYSTCANEVQPACFAAFNAITGRRRHIGRTGSPRPLKKSDNPAPEEGLRRFAGQYLMQIELRPARMPKTIGHGRYLVRLYPDGVLNFPGTGYTRSFLCSIRLATTSRSLIRWQPLPPIKTILLSPMPMLVEASLR